MRRLNLGSASKTFRFLASAGTLILVASCGAAAAPIDHPRLEDFGWLAGDWVSCDGERHTWERWRPLNGSLIGRGSVEMAGETMSEEDLHIEQRGESFVYVASPEGQPSTEFALVRMTTEELVFENAEHSHPQRIRYRLRDDGSLQAVIEQLDGSQRRRWIFHADGCLMR